MKYKYLLIDCNNLFFRAFSVNLKKALKSESNVEVYSQTIYDAVKRINSLRDEFCYKTKDSFIYLLFDNPLSAINLRKTISEGEYKSSREPENLPKGFYNSLNIFIDVLKSYDNAFRIAQLETSEADDLTYPLLNLVSPTQDSLALCISADLDFARNITEHVHWYNYVDVYDIEGFKKKYEFNPTDRGVVMFKALHGDAVDNIVNAVPHLPRKILFELISKYNSIDKLLKDIYNTDYPKEIKSLIKDNEGILRRNEQLVDFVPIECNIESIIVECKENLQELRWWFRKLNLKFEERMIEEKGKWFKQRMIVRKY